MSKNFEEMSEKDWKSKLTDEEYRSLRLKGTDYPFTGEYLNNHDDGIYRCAGCDTVIFESDSKYDSGCGWPSFDRPINEEVFEINTDLTHGMIRKEIVCSKCGGHIGHVFPDGPRETTGLRYCTNSSSLRFEDE
jgi:peptide-methionine (R)-S-oxide reductase